MSKQFYNMVVYLVLIALLLSACQPNPSVTATGTSLVALYTATSASPTTNSTIIESQPNLFDGAYFGQKPPGLTPEVFAPGLVSLPDRRETKIIFSPNGLLAIIGANKRLFYAQLENGHWSDIQPADFLDAQMIGSDVEPFISPDGQKLFFIRNANIWMSTLENNEWSNPFPLDSPINTSSDEDWHPTVTADGTLYFGTNRDKPDGGYAIYCSRLTGDEYTQVEKLDGAINSQYGAWDPFIAPDESYMIFSSQHPDGYGKADQYISYYRDGNWSEPKNLGPEINTSGIEYGSYISPDGKYYFFSRPIGWGVNDPADIFWVDSRVIFGDAPSK